MDLGTPPESGGETLISLTEKVNQINQQMFPRLPDLIGAGGVAFHEERMERRGG
jgi:hypothetical protein